MLPETQGGRVPETQPSSVESDKNQGIPPRPLGGILPRGKPARLGLTDSPKAFKFSHIPNRHRNCGTQMQAAKYILGVLAIALLAGLSPPATSRTQDLSAARLASALEHAENEKWDSVQEAMSGLRKPLAKDIVKWVQLRGGEGSLEDYLSFTKARSNWPGMWLIHKMGEGKFSPGTSGRLVIGYFRKIKPQTGAGSLALAQAYIDQNRKDAAHREIARAWQRLDLTREEHDRFIKSFGQILAPHHQSRMERLLWAGSADQAKWMLPLVGSGAAKLARARIALRKSEPGVDAKIQAVPSSLMSDPGLAFERFLWSFKRDRLQRAADLLIAASESRQTLGRPHMWTRGRLALARELMERGDARTAYKVASVHQLKPGPDYAELEWLAGYMALRKLGNPGQAIVHFKRLNSAVKTPISKGRAGYWLGIAYEMAGQPKNSRSAFLSAAKHQTSFYGQLAAEKAGARPDPKLAGSEDPPDWRAAKFANEDIVQAAILLSRAGAIQLAARFLAHRIETMSPGEIAQAGQLAEELEAPHIAVVISKQAVRRGIVMPRIYFPLSGIASMNLMVPPEVTLSITRRESEFFESAISPAGARGLMQLMPETARKMAQKTGLGYSKAKLLEDPFYNVKLGTAYLAERLEEYGGSYILAFAAYNAGPARVRQWISKFGDPRAVHVDPVDWIEHIPFRETRNYVMRAMESLLVYRARMSGKPGPFQLVADLNSG